MALLHLILAFMAVTIAQGADTFHSKYIIEEKGLRDMTYQINQDIKLKDIVTYVKPNCAYASWMFEILHLVGYRANEDYAKHHLNDDYTGRSLWPGSLIKANNWKTTPYVYVCHRFIGGGEDVRNLAVSGDLEKCVAECPNLSPSCIQALKPPRV